ncbi:flavin-dependent dehydrogenase [Pseudanabaena sp. FACHB-1998]|uniref:flavin-dependent dehydrogenase n=1 Tax=Pseudanabaena sp. FACHB-1998 TaxID=2692858 RepID=UPI001681347A|nr:flavin-dependent dehydrogenase [Pseudanabaena sp. FACHB-1998]MBD2175449.1 flavin-dependent dehydrogenase [Pseudanabaena sp. FACHB-1998]
MQQLLYIEIPTTQVAAVKTWLQTEYQPPFGKKSVAKHGFILDRQNRSGAIAQLSVFIWTLQRTAYLKVFRWSDEVMDGEKEFLDHLTKAARQAFPYEFKQPPAIAPNQSIFAALVEEYPLTVKFFQRIPNGEYDLNRVYWWEKRWRESVKNPETPKQVIFEDSQANSVKSDVIYDIVYLGGALGAIHAAMMAKLGYRVCLVERIPFGRMNREWNISRAEFQNLIDFGLFTKEEFEVMITAEYVDGFNKFFDSNNPPHLKAKVLHTPTVLNIAIDTNRLLEICSKKLHQYGAVICDRTEFQKVVINDNGATIFAKNLETDAEVILNSRLVIDAMGSASAIAQQLNAGQAFDSVCPTVGAVLEGFDKQVWDSQYGDVLFSHGDISRGRQLIWELFPAEKDELTIYLFHYHQVHPENAGSLLEMYEDFFTILPEYRRCDMEKLTWKKATFGYITGHYSLNEDSKKCAFDRILAIGDAASLQSPLVFTGFGSLVRNLPRLATLLDTALKHDLLRADDLSQINAYQSNIAVTWLFSKGMMVPTGMYLPPERVNSMLNTFFGLLADEPQPVSDRFIKDRLGWLMFNRLALIAAFKNPQLILWIFQMAGLKDLLKWLSSYGAFTRSSLTNALLGGWLPPILRNCQPWLEPNNPRLWLRLLSWSYAINYSVGKNK